MKTENPRLDCIDFLRGFAMFLVFVAHARVAAWTGMQAAWSKYGLQAPLDVWLGYLSFPVRYSYAGLILFFVLSGYCIHRMNHRHFPVTMPVRNRLGAYFWRRFFRIYPTLFFALLLTFILDSLGRKFGDPQLAQFDNSLKTFLLNLGTLQAYLLNSYGSNYPLWSLAVEEHIYMIYPLMLWFTRKKSIRWLLVVTFVVSLSAGIAAELNYRVHADFLPFLFSWTLGALVAEMEQGKIRSNFLTKKWVAVVSLFCFVVLYEKGQVLLAQMVQGVGCAIFLFWVINNRDHAFFRLWISKQMTLLGKISYSVYILHVPLIIFFSNFVLRGERSFSFLPTVFALIFSLLGSSLFYLAIERWTIKWLQGQRKIEVATPPSEELPHAA